jgi:predicted permease
VSPLRLLLWRLRRLLRDDQLDRDLQDEIAAHLEEAIAEHMQQGLTPEDARREALRQFGGVTQAREAYRDVHSFAWFEDAQRDIGYAARTLRRAPVFASVVVLTLAVGIGVNTALLSIVRQVLLKTLPVPHPEQLVEIDCDSGPGSTGGGPRCMQSYPAFRLLSANHSGLSGIAAFAPVAYGLVAAHHGRREVITGQVASANLFDVLEIHAEAGRLLGESDDRPGAPPVVVLSDRYWMRQFDGSLDAIGQTLVLNNTTLTIVGILPRSFRGVTLGEPYDAIVPLGMANQFRSGPSGRSGVRTNILDAANMGWLTFLGRSRPGVSPSDIGRRLEPVFRDATDSYLGTIPQAVRKKFNLTSDRIRVIVRPAGFGTASNLRSTLEPTLRVLLVVAALVLLIACVNIAGLFLAQALSRHREFGLRLALGAGRSRLLRQVFTESIVLALLAGGLGFLIAQWVGPLGFTLATDDTGLRAIDLRPDGWMLAMATGLSAITGIVIGCISTIRVSAANPQQALRNVPAQGSPRLAKGLMVAQIAFTMMLVGSASLLLQTLTNFRDIDLGFKPQQLTTATIDPGLSAFDCTRLTDYVARTTEALAVLPGVAAVTYANRAMGTGVPMNLELDVPGLRESGGNSPSSGLIYAGPNFVHTTGLDLLAGRDFGTSDDRGSERTAIVNESFAAQFFGTTAVIGRTFSLRGPANPPIAITGVVRDARDRGVKRGTTPMMYLPFMQGDERAVTFMIRAVRPHAVTATTLRETIERIDPSVGIARIETAEQQINDVLRRERLLAGLGVTFSGVALLLMAIGLYGMLNTAIVRRTVEIGVRMALGASRGQIVQMLANQTLRVVTVGVGLGAVGYALAGHFIQHQLFGVAPVSRTALSATVAALALVATAAVWMPSRRATRISPSDALRHEQG